MKIIKPNITTSHIEAHELPKHINQVIQIHGMIYKIRKMSGFAFVLLQTKSSLLQCIWSSDVASFPLQGLSEGMAVALTGLVTAEERSHSGCELRIVSFEELSRPVVAEPPVVINNKEVTASLSTLLDYRPLTLRNQKERAIFRLQSGICQGFRSFLASHAFTEIRSPKICAGTAEGGANVFALDYFGRQAFLAQSPQFYKQMMVGVYERVYEIGPVFRAEKHDTSRHINEYTSIDLELGFINSFYEIMELELQMLSSCFAHLQANYAPELTLLGVKLPKLEEMPAITFAEAKELVAKTYNRPITDFEDFEPEEEKLLSEVIERQTGSELVFVTHYKSSKRPFYTMDTPSDPQVTESFDLIFRGMEITTGGQRIHDYNRQVAKMQERGMDVEAFSDYLMAHKHGLPPHGGLGLGLERFTAKLLGFANVRHATLFPRDVNRLMP